MKVLCVKQPWAWAITECEKDIENRTQRRFFRGEFLIHATKWGMSHEFDAASEFIYNISGKTPPDRKYLEYGGIVGRASVVDCVEEHESPWFEGPYGFVLKNVQRIDFIPCKGKIAMFWELDSDTLSKIYGTT